MRNFLFLILGLACVCWGAVMVWPCSLPVAFAEETITITTYYPSPYGSYNQLSTNRLAVGYTDSTEQPDRNGDIRLTPQAGNPQSWTGGREGQVSYSGQDDFLYVHNGTNWIKQRGGGLDAYVKTGSNPTCDSGYLPLSYYWLSMRCEGGICPDCNTIAKYAVEPPTCEFGISKGLEDCYPATCAAGSWSKVVCVKN